MLEVLQLLIYGDAERLEDLRRGMDLASPFALHPLDDFNKFFRRLNRLVLSF